MQRTLLSFIVWLAVASGAVAAEVMPPKPARWFNDYAGVVPAATARELDAKLEQFERDTSNQVVVAVWRDMQTDSSLQDYTFRIFEQWQLGQSGKYNGIGLFVFIEPRKMFMQVGYGLEGAVPDALAKRIIEEEIAPHFKAGDYGAGLAAGVDAILAATRGEYKGSGRTAGEHFDVERIFNIIRWIIIGFVALNILAAIVHMKRRGLEISGRGSRWLNVLDTILTIFRSSSGGGVSFGGSGGWSGGGGGRSGGGGFSGGGGRSGGGGAGGSW